MNWINIKNDLPKEKTWVLCYNGSIRIKFYEKGMYYDGTTYGYSPSGLINDVTHWMPLPSKPEKDKK